MKHTDLHNEYKKLDSIEAEELVAAVKAHGNEYVFVHLDDEGDYDIEERDNAPIIAASTGWMDAYEDFYISRVEVDNGFYTLDGWATEGCGDEVEIDSVAHGHLGYVIDCIPATDDVKDVTLKRPTPILIFSPEDVANVGYNPDMTVSQFNELKRLMEKSFEWNMDIYWDALRQACENLGIEPLNKSDEDEKD